MDAFFLVSLLLKKLFVLLFFFLFNLLLRQFPSFILTLPKASDESDTRFSVKLYSVPTPFLFILGTYAGFSHINKLQ